MKKEEWKTIPNYEGLYEVSSLGRVKSVRKNKILKPILNSKYLKVSLSNYKKYRIHQLMVITFLNHKPDGTYKLVVDHINGDYLDNRLENLQLISQRENVSKSNKLKTSKYIGVSWSKQSKKWHSSITINKKLIHLGYFNCELEASIVYQNKFKEINYGL